MTDARHIKAADLQRLGVSKPYAHQLVGGTRSPSLKLALRLEAELGIPVSAWPLADGQVVNVPEPGSPVSDAKPEIVQ